MEYINIGEMNIVNKINTPKKSKIAECPGAPKKSSVFTNATNATNAARKLPF